MKRLLQAYRCQDPTTARRQLATWYQTPLGQTLAEQEQQLLDSILDNLFGYHLLQLGNPAEIDLLRSSRISHRMMMDLVPQASAGDKDKRSEQFLAHEAALPILSNSIDVMLLPHLLEFSANPHDALREVERVLIPEGHLVLLGFNPFGLWGISRAAVGWRNLAPWCGRFLSHFRIQDWLALLGFEIRLAKGYMMRPPIQRPGVMKRMAFMESLSRPLPVLSAAYVLVARKRVTTITPIKPRWRPRRSLLGNGLVKPTLNRNRDS